MIAEFKHHLGRLRGQIIGWSIGLALYGLMMALLFDSIAEIEGFQEIIESYPPELMAFFGDMAGIATPKGYLDIYYFSYMTLIIGIFAVSVCAGLLVGDEEQGTLDLVLSYPISRGQLFLGRLLAFISALAIILLVGWLSWVIPAQGTTMDLSWLEFLRPFIPLAAQLLLFGGLALLLSMLLPAKRMASMLTGALLVGNFLLLGLANLNSELEQVVEFTPMYHYQGGDAISGIEWSPVFWIMLIFVLFSAASWLIFRRRDIRVGGERSWQLPRLGGMLKRT